jgi:hypothetical protein
MTRRECRSEMTGVGAGASVIAGIVSARSMGVGIDPVTLR